MYGNKYQDPVGPMGEAQTLHCPNVAQVAKGASNETSMHSEISVRYKCKILQYSAGGIAKRLCFGLTKLRPKPLGLLQQLDAKVWHPSHLQRFLTKVAFGPPKNRLFYLLETVLIAMQKGSSDCTHLRLCSFIIVFGLDHLPLQLFKIQDAKAPTCNFETNPLLISNAFHNQFQNF